MAELSKPSTACAERNVSAGCSQRTDTSSVKQDRRLCKGNSSGGMPRSVPPVHELTSHNIGYKSNSSMVRYQKTAPAPTNMSYLPSAQEKLLQSRKLLAKVVGFDAAVFELKSKIQRNVHPAAQSVFNTDEDTNSPRYSNAFAPARSPRAMRSSVKEMELSRSEILKGQSVPATPRLLRRGDSKNYGVRRQISAHNQLELSPDLGPESAVRKSALRFNTPAGDQSALPTPAAEEEAPSSPIKSENELDQSRQSQYSSNHVAPFGREAFEVTKTALTNSLVARDRNRDAPWVYCYKVKKDRLKLSQLLTTKYSADPAVDELLPAF